MSEQVEVRECPCCGGDGLVLKSQYGNIGEHWVTCRQCRLKTGWYTTRDDAIAAWNKRAPDADNDRLRKLEGAVDAIVYHVDSDAGRERHWFIRERVSQEQSDAIGRLLEEPNE